jgi:hypothetical protein
MHATKQSIWGVEGWNVTSCTYISFQSEFNEILPTKNDIYDFATHDL